jgi:anti-sigma regulatory factor (Ser/Thr protein kinase)
MTLRGAVGCVATVEPLLCVRLPFEARSVKDARSWARDRLVVAGDDPPEFVEQLTLVVSELVTNALRHGAPPLELCAARRANETYVEVRDAGLGSPTQRRPADGLLGHGGLGLNIVATIATRWGVDAHPGGTKTVWCWLDSEAISHERR